MDELDSGLAAGTAALGEIHRLMRIESQMDYSRSYSRLRGFTRDDASQAKKPATLQHADHALYAASSGNGPHALARAHARILFDLACQAADPKFFLAAPVAGTFRELPAEPIRVTAEKWPDVAAWIAGATSQDSLLDLIRQICYAKSVAVPAHPELEDAIGVLCSNATDLAYVSIAHVRAADVMRQEQRKSPARSRRASQGNTREGTPALSGGRPHN